MFSYQYGGTLLTIIDGYSMPYLLVSDIINGPGAMPLILLATPVAILVIVTYHIIRSDYRFELKQFPETYLLAVLGCFSIGVLFQIKFSLILVPYVLLIPLLVAGIASHAKYQSEVKQTTCSFFVLCAGLATCFQFVNSGGFGGPIISLFSDGLVIGLIVYWCATAVTSKKTQRTIYISGFLFLLPISYIFDTGVTQKLSVFSYFPSGFKERNDYDWVVLNETTYRIEQKRNPILFTFQENQSAAYNDIYASVTNKRMDGTDQDHIVLNSITNRFLFPKRK